jgi:hypothetical protein
MTKAISSITTYNDNLAMKYHDNYVTKTIFCVGWCNFFEKSIQIFFAKIACDYSPKKANAIAHLLIKKVSVLTL